ncbi:hypothetical protein I4U23_001863 [Adineta vaga]|nr:hypothetical protein I4U23_001863 [Adineta vaga]
MNTYAISYGTELQKLVDAELSHLTRLLSTSKEQIDIWSKEYITEIRRLTISSLESLFGTKEYRSNVHQSTIILFNILSKNQSSVDDVSKSTIDLLNHLIISLYRQFMIQDKNSFLDDKLQKCLINKASEMDALSTQRELLYILTSGSSLIQIFRTMLIYIDADIQRLLSITTSTTMISNSCIQRFARETLCPLCVSESTSFNQILTDDNEPLCEDDCRYVTQTCFNQTTNPYVVFASIIKDYSIVIQDIEHAIIELKLVERLSKLHIYLYDMVVKAINSRHIYTQLQKTCPDPNGKPFSPILSLPPTIIESPELVYQWNRSLHFLLKQLQSSIDTLSLRYTQQIITDICSNSNYAVKSNRCTQIDKQNTNNFIQWSLPSIPFVSKSTNHAELTRNQLDDLKKKMIPVQQMIVSLRPKKKYNLIEYIPNFDLYDDELNTMNINDHLPSSTVIDTYDNDIHGSLSERLYKEIDEQTTRRSYMTLRQDSKQKVMNHGQTLSNNIALYLIISILYPIFLIRK